MYDVCNNFLVARAVIKISAEERWSKHGEGNCDDYSPRNGRFFVFLKRESVGEYWKEGIII